MAHWGIALANGPHINYPLVPPPAAEAAWKALQLAQKNAGKGSPVEQALIEALGHRYANPQPEDREPLDRAYADAMREVWKQYPNDPDVGALFAEAMMDLAAVGPMDARGPAQPGTEEIIATLDAVLKLNSEPSVREPSLHSRGRSFAESRARGCRRGSACATLQPGSGAQRSHAVAHRHPAGPLATGDRDQSQGRRGRPALSEDRRAAHGFAPALRRA